MTPPSYRTLYLLHGVNGNQEDWLIHTQIADFSEAHQMAVIMPAGENRFYVDRPERHENYSQFIGEDLVTLTRRLFPLSTKRKDTYLAGPSMDGYGALYNGTKYAEHFSKVDVFSAALIMKAAEQVTDESTSKLFFNKKAYYESLFGNVIHLTQTHYNSGTLAIDKQQKYQQLPEYFITCGTQDTLLSYNRDLITLFKNHGISHTYKEFAGGHEWAFWNESVRLFLEWLDEK